MTPDDTSRASSQPAATPDRSTTTDASPSSVPAIPRLPNPARGEDGRSLRLERFLPYRLSVLANRISSTLARAYADTFDLTIPEWRVVAVLGRFAPLTANAICDATEMDKVTVSRAVQRLERAGRIERTVDDADRRRVLLRLSPAGLDILARIAPLALDYEDRLIAELTPAEREALVLLIDRLTDMASRTVAGTKDDPAR
ncbi:MarR family winged helix-turn-helix transcriptional regulator [Tistrella bauzanensis]|uniref:MarR family winged helix-turn-helix transcriptional regulator n=1 Tax=Tistrella TaxID=171436 RepID=UPI0031F6E5BF